MSKLNDEINALIIANIKTRQGKANAIEALSNALATVIAISANGNTKDAEHLLTGTEEYIQGCVSDKLNMIKAIR